MSGNYYRAFLPVKQERSDYSLSGRTAVGRAVIEAKGDTGKISVIIQDVKPNSQLEIYLIADISNEYVGVYVGKILINERGKGDCRHEFNASNVKKSNIAIEKFTIAALIIPKEGELIAPFVGYKNEAVAWKVNFKFFTEVETSEASDIQIEATEEHGEQKENNLSSALEIEEKEIVAETIAEEITKSAEEEIEAVQEAQEIKPNHHEKFKNIARKFNEQLEELSHDEKQDDIPPISEEIEKLFEINTIMYPFKQKKSDVTWVRVSPKNLVKLPPEISMYANCPLVLNGYRSFKHLIFGKFNQGRIIKFLLGVPDIYYEQKQQSAAEYGFNKFECCDGEEIFNGAYGYWVMII